MLLWLDLETTGLDESVHGVLEVGAILTDAQLREVARIHRVVSPPFELSGMQEAVRRMHTENGLLAECFEQGVAVDRADEDVALWLEEHTQRPPILAGSNPGFDRRWAATWLPAIHQRLHYRSLDVNTIWALMDIRKPRPVGLAHRSMLDLERDLELARVARAALLAGQVGVPA